MKIAVDLDDTLSVVDRITRPSAYIARMGLPYRVTDPNAHALRDVYDWPEEEAIKFVKSGGISVFTEAEARKGVKEVLSRWRAAGHTVTVLTARDRAMFSNPASLSRDWLQKRKIPYDELVAECMEKGEYCVEHGISVLIDDNLQNCLKAQQKGVYAVLFEGKNNLSRAGEVRFGGGTWQAIEGEVEYITRLIGKNEHLA
jgi:uncharacterized HAD superfamily protein